MEKVAVVILNYKVRQEVLECISSVGDSDYENLDIIVVDNNSCDGLREDIQQFSDVKYIENQQNLGYTGGNNIGIKHALSSGADYVFILNPDTKIAKNAISEMIKTMKQYQAGIGSPKILFGDQKTIWFAGGMFDQNNVIGTHKGVNEEDKGQYNQIEETGYATGCAMMVNSLVFNKIGLFDEKYFMYYEDSDFSLRAKQAGFKVVYIPQAVVIHKNAQSTGLGSPLQDYFITRNRMLFALKHLSFRTQFALLREMLKNILITPRRVAMIDFMMGNFGKGSYIK